MKQIPTPLKMLSAIIALLAVAAACASTQSKENSLVAAGFSVVVPKTAAQQEKLKALPPDQVTMVQKSGKTYYVFPDPANNQAYVCGPQNSTKRTASSVCRRNWPTKRLKPPR